MSFNYYLTMLATVFVFYICIQLCIHEGAPDWVGYVGIGCFFVGLIMAIIAAIYKGNTNG